MKTIYKLKKLSIALISLVLITACEKDGEKIYLSGTDGNKFIVAQSDVTLTKEKDGQIVLSTTWNATTLTVSNPHMGAPNVLAYSIQMSTQEDFSSNTIKSPGDGQSKSFTGAELNAIALKLGLAPNVKTPVYCRLQTSVGNNMEPAYSNIVKVNITPYIIDMTIVYILNSGKEMTDTRLYSPQANGIYTGFIGATAWYNFYMEEGDGTIWGNYPVAGYPFIASSGTECWNFWFPAPAGCYYTEINTVKKQWSATYLPTLAVNGDITGEMTYDRSSNRWYYVFNATTSGNITINLSGKGQVYNNETGDTTPAAHEVTLAFAQTANGLILTHTSGNITVNIPAAGESTLILDLNNQTYIINP